ATELGAWSEAIGFYEAALTGTAGAERVRILLQLGEARWRTGRSVEASEAFREALAIARQRGDAVAADEASLALANSLMTQARYAEAIALARQVLEAGRPTTVRQAEFQLGAALSVEGADLAAATSHLEAAEALRARSSPADPLGLAEVKFELGSVAAQEGDLDRAIALYQESLEMARRYPDEDAAAPRIVLALNNLGYHLLLKGDPSAETHALAGLDLAREKGLLGLMPYLLSTLGEIALARGDLDQAEARFSEGLELAEQVGVPERVAGLTANLGLVAQRRGETALAVHQLSTALARADSLGTRHLAAQIRIWLAPLLPPAQARTNLLEARAIAEVGNRRRLLAEVAELEQAADRGRG
ncbi:MAG TPA: tetratricopeptide repeat protein, partial [Solirubrobacterales bacterium]